MIETETRARLGAFSRPYRAGLADFETQDVNQPAIPYEGHYSEAQVDDLAFRKMLAQAVEGFLRRLPMVAGKYLGETDRRLFRRGQFFAVFKMRNFGDQFFGQSLLPCQGKPGAESQATLIFLRYLEASQLRQSHVD